MTFIGPPPTGPGRTFLIHVEKNRQLVMETICFFDKTHSEAVDDLLRRYHPNGYQDLNPKIPFGNARHIHIDLVAPR